MHNNSQQTGPDKNKPVFYLLTAGITLLLILGLGELAARIFHSPHHIPPAPPPSTINPYRPNPYIVNMRPYIYFHIPGASYSQKIFSYENSYTINSMGFRGDDFSLEPEHGKKRLVVLGDSIVEGHGVAPDETFSALLDKKLATDKIEVLNLGVQGASPVYFAANLERFLYLKPDAVLLVIHENDLFDDEIREKGYFDAPVLANRAELYSGGTTFSPVKISRLWSLLSTSFHTLRKSRLEKLIDANAKTPGIHAERKTDRKLSSFAVPENKFDQRWEMSREYLTYTARALEEKRITLMVSSLCTVTMALADIKEYTEHCRRLNNGIAEWADEQNIPYYSLVPVVKQTLDENKTKDVLILNDFHPTPFTHNIIADTLYPFIVNTLSSTGTGNRL